MKNTLPKILGAGFFDSEKRFKNIKTTTERKVTCFEIELFTKSGGVSIVNGKKHHIKKGNILIAKPDDLRFSILHFSCKYLHIEITDGVTAEFIKALPTFIERDLTEELSYIFDDIYNIVLYQNEFPSVFAAAKIFELICKIKGLEAQKLQDLLKSKNRQIALAVEYINNNYKAKINTEDIAKASLLSVSYMHKKFLETVGMAPTAYLNSVRITEAKKLLLTTNLSLTQIAEECGFQSASYFNHFFSSSVGTTPAKFRLSSKYEIEMGGL